MAQLVTVLSVLICCFAYRVSGAAGHNTHTHHSGGSVTGGIHFSYDPTLHHLVAITTGTCFMVSLTHDERDHVHSSTGLEDLELKMMREWIGKLPEVKIYHDDTHLPTNIQKWCATKDIFLLERDVTEMTSPMSPLASVSPSG